MKEHFKLFGFRVRDKVTGFEGVCTSISFDLYGCVQALVTPPHHLEEAKCASNWYDVKRLEAKSAGPVMELPDFEIVPGGQDLPVPSQSPAK